jgi:cytochrome c-type biogenesis protein CcmF
MAERCTADGGAAADGVRRARVYRGVVCRAHIFICDIGFLGRERLFEFAFAKPLLYKITGVWGNHEGSMLLWALILALFSARWSALSAKSAAASARERARRAGTGSRRSSFFSFSHFQSVSAAGQSRRRGAGTQSVLQDIGLALHPPLLYLGYVGFSISFSFAVAALIEGRIDAAWARWVRPWTLRPGCFLTLGIAMGSYWAYYELGWGGWWFWDPVENASLMPWIAGRRCCIRRW